MVAETGLLLTGAPGVGKTTVLVKTVDSLRANDISVGGMISQEAREGYARVGFEIMDLANGKYGWLAHINQQSGPQVGKYCVNLQDLENIGAKPLWTLQKNATSSLLTKLVQWSFTRKNSSKL